MRGRLGAVAARGRKAKAFLHSSSATSLLGPNLPDVWTVATSSSRSTSSANCGPAQQRPAKILDGNLMAREIRSGIACEVCRVRERLGKSPGLAIVVVGQRKDSHTFVQVKMKACEEVGISTFVKELSEGCSQEELFGVVSRLNRDSSVHGIIVQLPLPQELDEERIIDIVNPAKDVDGFHPMNMGNLAMRGREPFFIPCAPKSCIELLLRSGVEIMGKRAVVVGRSKIVGLPISLLLQRHHATVSTVHAFTKNPDQITREADIVVADVGIPNIVRGSWLKAGAVVVDMGTTQVEELTPDGRKKYRIMGDVCYEEAVEVASAITPVPGGVGPVTISMLLSNTLDSAKRAIKVS
ncbi:hypothetical protein MLD38_040326 [Melastoma candidum]|uniref:Uncharacterized protein n=1 Tax=Melastoma candidum TaxID=119954 RepID=A0ACB9L5T0_9MYRT|nr:hypothetical protein MLD38_040326 [Melastoma candidum]